MSELLYFKRPHMDDGPPDAIYVADSYEDPLYTMVPATFDEVVAWVERRRSVERRRPLDPRAADLIVDKTETNVRRIQNIPDRHLEPLTSCSLCGARSGGTHVLPVVEVDDNYTPPPSAAPAVLHTDDHNRA